MSSSITNAERTVRIRFAFCHTCDCDRSASVYMTIGIGTNISKIKFVLLLDGIFVYLIKIILFPSDL